MMYKLYWIGTDGSVDLCMGPFASEEEAEAAIPEALDELTKLDTNDVHRCRDRIMNGTWFVQQIGQ